MNILAFEKKIPRKKIRSSTHISRLLHKYTEKTFKTLITDLQMESAKKLLMEGNMTITEISQEVGCFDSSHFSHKFRSYYGISPEEFRSREAGKRANS